MKLLHFQKQTEKILFYVLIAAGIYFPSSISIAQAQDMPIFRQGMWEFNRTVEDPNDPGKPQTMVTNRCTNPTDDMKKQSEMFSKLGCKMSTVSKNGKTYTFTADCKIKNTTVESTSVMTVENDTAYSAKVESKSGDQTSKEALKARRTGDCTK